MSTEKLFQIRFLAKAERLSLVRVLVKEMAESVGCCVELSEKLVIAVNEACMNIIQHAYKGDESGEIVFEMLNNEKELHFRLVDYACPIDLNSVKPRDLNDIRPVGWELISLPKLWMNIVWVILMKVRGIILI